LQFGKLDVAHGIDCHPRPTQVENRSRVKPGGQGHTSAQRIPGLGTYGRSVGAVDPHKPIDFDQLRALGGHTARRHDYR
jgi:hypothetical protein